MRNTKILIEKQNLYNRRSIIDNMQPLRRSTPNITCRSFFSLNNQQPQIFQQSQTYMNKFSEESLLLENHSKT